MWIKPSLHLACDAHMELLKWIYLPSHAASEGFDWRCWIKDLDYPFKGTLQKNCTISMYRYYVKINTIAKQHLTMPKKKLARKINCNLPCCQMYTSSFNDQHPKQSNTTERSWTGSLCRGYTYYNNMTIPVWPPWVKIPEIFQIPWRWMSQNQNVPRFCPQCDPSSSEWELRDSGIFPGKSSVVLPLNLQWQKVSR